jgi:hypothetical protein
MCYKQVGLEGAGKKTILRKLELGGINARFSDTGVFLCSSSLLPLKWTRLSRRRDCPTQQHFVYCVGYEG